MGAREIKHWKAEKDAIIIQASGKRRNDPKTIIESELSALWKKFSTLQRYEKIEYRIIQLVVFDSGIIFVIHTCKILFLDKIYFRLCTKTRTGCWILLFVVIYFFQKILQQWKESAFITFLESKLFLNFKAILLSLKSKTKLWTLLTLAEYFRPDSCEFINNCCNL